MRITSARLRSAFAALVLAIGLLLGVPATARAASDVVRSLDVSYAIQADGTVRVRQQLAWRFGDTGRHGIELRIATRESWDADPDQDVLYEVTNLQVTSPTGAPDQVTQRTEGQGSVEALVVRIGDPDRTVDGRDQTYVVTYDLRGALRTFDGFPELFWDVTSEDFPAIDAFTVRVTAPGGVQRGRCLVAEGECDLTLVDGVATLTGHGVEQGQVVSVVAGLTPGAVADAGARPTLAPRRITETLLTGIATDTTVRPDGTAHVEQRLEYRFPAADADRLLQWALPSRRPWSGTEDAVLTLGGVSVTVDGRPAEVSVAPGRDEGSRQWVELRARAVPSGTPNQDPVTVVLAYDVTGAVASRGGEATYLWPIAGVDLDEVRKADFVWRLPVVPFGAECRVVSAATGASSSCGSWGNDFTTSGSTVTLTSDRPATGADEWHARITLPPAAVGGVAPRLEPSIDRAREEAATTTLVGSFLAFVALFVTGLLLGRRPLASDVRFAGVAPGTVNPADAATTAARRDDVVAVRFSPPDVTPAEAGVLLERGYRPTQLAATLVGLAVAGSVLISTSPLSVVRTGVRPEGGTLADRVWRAASKPTKKGRTRKLSVVQRRTMVKAAQEAADATLADSPYVLGADELAQARRTRRRQAAMLFAGVALGLVAVGLVLQGRTGVGGAVIAVLGMAGVGLGWLVGRPRAGRPVLSATGTAVRDQVRGFRDYISTAEADQLAFEADADIFRHYLPWAVLFGLTERWTRICRELAEAGRIPPIDTSFWGGDFLPDDLARGIADLTRDLANVPAASSSSGSGSGFFSGGGSGGSSGFSSGSSGGGGGGGTSAGSW